jgi:hypothetical protein
MIKYLAQFNIALSFFIIWTNWNKSAGILTSAILLVVIWYSWITILLINKQNIAKRSNYMLGIINILIGVLILADSLIKIYIGFLEKTNKVALILIIPSVILSISILMFSFITLKMHNQKKNIEAH